MAPFLLLFVKKKSHKAFQIQNLMLKEQVKCKCPPYHRFCFFLIFNRI